MKANLAGVTASHAAAAQIGALVLREGGNAVDAAVATALASCVADPGNTGIAGYGGHMVIAAAGSNPVCIDFNMWLPARWSASLYRRTYPNCSPLVTAVPNVVAGLALALERFGSMRWSSVVEPSIALASSGVDANETTLRTFKEIEGTAFEKECFAFQPADGAHGKEGLRFRQPALARTLEQLSKYGPDWFYDGPVGHAACEILERAGSPISRKEWLDAPRAVRVMSAAKFDISAGTLFSAPLGTSGSASLFATVAAGQTIAESVDIETPEAVLSWAQALAAIWTYRFGVPGGNDFRDTTIAKWTEQALKVKSLATIPQSAGHTCHLNTCDASGTLVAMTLTHGQFMFGGRWVIPNTGLIMNAGMHLLTAADPIVAGNRSYAVTNMAPTIALLHNGASIAIGCPGARRIPTSVGLVLVRHLVGGQSLQDAVSRGRFHAETYSTVSVEMSRWNRATLTALKSAFSAVDDEAPRGPLTAIRREPNGSIIFGLDDRSGRGFAAVNPPNDNS